MLPSSPNGRSPCLTSEQIDELDYFDMVRDLLFTSKVERTLQHDTLAANSVASILLRVGVE